VLHELPIRIYFERETPYIEQPPFSANMSNGILKIEGEKVVDGKGNPVILRGAGLGGWMK
jgi:hypothetical protein